MDREGQDLLEGVVRGSLRKLEYDDLPTEEKLTLAGNLRCSPLIAIIYIDNFGLTMCNYFFSLLFSSGRKPFYGRKADQDEGEKQI